MREWEDIVSDLKKLNDDAEALIRRRMRLLYWETALALFLFLGGCVIIYMIKGV